MFHKTIFLPLASIAVLSGCSTGVLIGEVPSDPPPQIVYLGEVDRTTGRDYLTWKDIPSFGNVPSDLKSLGDMSCMQYGMDLRAIGYHPKAKDRKGNEIPGGGFYCSPQFLGASYSNPPQLIETPNGVEWDSPGSFKAISESEQAAADTVCQSTNKELIALGYHQDAKDLNGNKIPNGGFLCVKPLQQY